MSNLKKKLLQFLSGRYSDEGKAIYDAWYKSFDNTAGDVVPEASQAEMEHELSRIKGNNMRRLPVQTTSFAWMRLAASLLILVTASAVIYFQWTWIINTIDPVTYAEISAAKGERRQVQLSDGSQVWLNAGTKFRYPEKFKRGTREVYLDGEAYFNVAHDVAKPFVIHTGKLAATVLGTSFNIRAYAGTQQEVAVITGKVSVQVEENETVKAVVLTPGSRAVLSEQGLRQESFSGFDQYTAWKDGKLVFEDVLARDMLASINRFYNTDIRFRSDSLGLCRITTVLEPQSVKEVLALLAFTLNTTYTHEGDVYWIEGQGCK